MQNYNYQEITYPSSDGRSTVHGYIYTPKNATAKGIVQLSHGMIDHVGRYKALADYLCSVGYIFAGNDHLGHGRTAPTADDLGFFADRDGYKLVIEDLYGMNRRLRDMFPALPLVLLGHSMGSFLARLYIEEHPHSAQGVIIHGTSGPNPLLPMGRAVAALVRLLRGPRHRSRLIKSLAFGSYNKRFPKEEGDDAWLTRDVDRVGDRATDPYTSYIFTAAAYQDLFKMITYSNSKRWFSAYPYAAHTLVISGDMDPVGNYGKGPAYVFRHLALAGRDNISLKLFEGARHELFNETNSDEVFEYLKDWLDGVVK